MKYQRMFVECLHLYEHPLIFLWRSSLYEQKESIEDAILRYCSESLQNNNIARAADIPPAALIFSFPLQIDFNLPRYGSGPDSES